VSLDALTLTAGNNYALRARPTTRLGLVGMPPETHITAALVPLTASVQENTLLGVHTLVVPVSSSMNNMVVFALAHGAVLTLNIPAGAIDGSAELRLEQRAAGILGVLLGPLQALTGVDFGASLSNLQTSLNVPALMMVEYPDPGTMGRSTAGRPAIGWRSNPFLRCMCWNG